MKGIISRSEAVGSGVFFTQQVKVLPHYARPIYRSMSASLFL